MCGEGLESRLHSPSEADLCFFVLGLGAIIVFHVSVVALSALVIPPKSNVCSWVTRERT